jgi:hypothetical protein
MVLGHVEQVQDYLCLFEKLDVLKETDSKTNINIYRGVAYFYGVCSPGACSGLPLYIQIQRPRLCNP